MQKSLRSIVSSKEISLSDLFILYWDRRKIIYFSIGFIFLLGMIRFFSSPTEYESVSVKLSESQESQGSLRQFSNLAGMAGLSLPSSSGGSDDQSFSPELYPKIIESTPFLLDLIKEKFYFQNKKDTLSLYDYFISERPGDWLSKSLEFLTAIPSIIFSSSSQLVPIEDSAIKNDEEDVKTKVLNVTPEQMYVIGALKKRLKIENVDRMITLSVRMPEPTLAAELNYLVFDKILNYVILYKVEKQRNNLKFFEKSVIEAETDFKKAQMSLASFRDANQGVVSQRVRTTEEMLEAEYSLSLQLYSSLKQEHESAKIELNREIPIFTNFEKAIVPLKPSNSSPLKTIILSIFGGFFLGLMVITLGLVRTFFEELKDNQ